MMLFITHPGSAHQDELLALSLLLASLDLSDASTQDPSEYVTIVRREPTILEVLDPTVFCIDVGVKAARASAAQLFPGMSDAELDAHAHAVASDARCSNFDHHGDRSCPAAFQLVAKYLHLDEDCRNAFAGWDFASKLDTSGPFVANAAFGISGDTSVSASLVEGALTSLFGQFTSVPHWFVQILGAIGETMIERAKTFRSSLEAHKRVVDLMPLAGGAVLMGDIVADSRAMRIIKDEIEAANGTCAGVSVSRSNRVDAQGKAPWTLYRYDDDKRYDFTRVQNHPMVEFAHGSGFLAQVNTHADWSVLRSIIALATIPGEITADQSGRILGVLREAGADAYEQGFECSQVQDLQEEAKAWHDLASTFATVTEMHELVYIGAGGRR